MQLHPETQLNNMRLNVGLKKKQSYRVGEVAKIFGFSERQVYRMVAEYEPGKKRALDSTYTRGGQHVVLWNELVDYLVPYSLSCLKKRRSLIS